LISHSHVVDFTISPKFSTPILLARRTSPPYQELLDLRQTVIRENNFGRRASIQLPYFNKLILRFMAKTPQTTTAKSTKWELRHRKHQTRQFRTNGHFSTTTHWRIMTAAASSASIIQ
jgi:hypothetical protein